MPRTKLHWIAYMWPGLPHLWIRGSWAGLVVAVGFTAVANVLLLATLVYREWIDGDALAAGYGALGVVWLLAWWQSRGERRSASAESPADAGAELVAGDDRQGRLNRMFSEAQQHYLANDWVATEQLLLELLKQDARDVDARLMLATLWRHQGRYAEARRQLDRLQRLEGAEKWRQEIAAERQQLDERTNPVEDTQQEDTNQTAIEPPPRRLAA